MKEIQIPSGLMVSIINFFRHQLIQGRRYYRNASSWSKYLLYHKQNLSITRRLLDKIELVEVIDDKEISQWADEIARLIRKTVLDEISSYDLSLMIAGAIAHRRRGQTPLNSHLSFINSYERTNGLAQELMHETFYKSVGIGLTNHQQALCTPPNSKDFDDEEVQASLNKTGYAVVPFKLSEFEITNLNKESSTLHFKSRGLDQTISNIDPENFTGHGVWDCNQNLKSIPSFRSISNNQFIIGIVRNYLQCDISIQEMSLWYTFPNSQPEDKSAQLFHYDLDSIKWVKVFVYLNDVDIYNGPHEYVQGTHAPGCKPAHLLEKGYKRVSDSQIDKYFPDSRQKILGSAGTIIIGDTKCYHKGNNPSKGYRLVFETLYSPTSLCYNKI